MEFQTLLLTFILVQSFLEKFYDFSELKVFKPIYKVKFGRAFAFKLFWFFVIFFERNYNIYQCFSLLKISPAPLSVKQPTLELRQRKYQIYGL